VRKTKSPSLSPLGSSVDRWALTEVANANTATHLARSHRGSRHPFHHNAFVPQYTGKGRDSTDSPSWVEVTARKTNAMHIRCDRGEENEVR
jgi:hypothetical protein